jgi:hypothetical protein
VGERWSALVLLTPGPLDDGAVGEPAFAPAPDSVARLAEDWFRRQGFEVGPVVGTSFAVTGDRDVFLRHLGFDPAAGGTLAPSARRAMPADVGAVVLDVMVPAPPDFGPWNP